jgi:hypothetical protein
MNDDRFAIDPNLVRQPARGPIYYAFCVVIPLQAAYVFGFNYLPDVVRLGFSSTLLAVHLGLSAITLLGRASSWNIMLLISILMSVVTWFPAHVMGMGEVPSVSLIELIRSIAWPLMLIWVLAYPLSLPRTILVWYAVGFTLIGAFVALTGPAVYVSGTARLASITSGIDNMHASAKLMAIQLLMLDQLRRAGLLSPRVAWPLMALAGFILLGFGGRNEMLFVLAYFGMRLYFAQRNDIVIRFAPYIAVGLAIVAATVILQIVAYPDNLGSGRIGVWAYRLYLISHRDPVTFLFGGGVGADRIFTPQWWYFDDASAHNDYLGTMMEGGVVGLLAMFVMMYGLWLRLPTDGRALVVAIGVNSFFANGFFTSPLLALSLSFVMALSILGELLRQANLAPPTPAPRARFQPSGPPPYGLPQP